MLHSFVFGLAGQLVAQGRGWRGRIAGPCVPAAGSPYDVITACRKMEGKELPLVTGDLQKVSQVAKAMTVTACHKESRLTLDCEESDWEIKDTIRKSWYYFGEPIM